MRRMLPLLVVSVVVASLFSTSFDPAAFARPVYPQETGPFWSARPFGTLRQQAEVQQKWLEERLEVNLPKIMRQQGVDMWVVSMREYNEDPVFWGLIDPTTFAARRRTIYIFFDQGPEEGVRRSALGGRPMKEE